MERRSAKRTSVDLPVEYAMSAEFGNGTLSARLQDICTNGIRILTDRPLKIGAVLRVDIPMSGQSPLLPVFTEVAWSGTFEGRFRAGLRFLK